jgi:LysR family transcriptional regulator, glycine cleavage system transcriptional activator
MDETSGPLPSLGAIRAFDAAARLGSFTRAASELHMTQAAVSYQIKLLEDQIGAPLFRRLPRGVALTEVGEQLSPTVIGAFRSMRTAFAQVHDRTAHNLSITALPSIGSSWLVPRLGEFQLRHPELAVRLETSKRMVDFDTEAFDVGLRGGHGKWPGVESDLLLRNELTPMCLPELAAQLARRSPRALLEHRLFGRPETWRRWFAALGVDPVDLPRRRDLDYDIDQYNVTAAIEGHGIALASPEIFSREVETRRLAKPFEYTVSSGDVGDFWLVYPTARRLAPKIVAFRRWILAEARNTSLKPGPRRTRRRAIRS